MGADKLESAMLNTALTSQLFMSLQTRVDADIEEFFMHEKKRDPLSLSDQGTSQIFLAVYHACLFMGAFQQPKRLL